MKKRKVKSKYFYAAYRGDQFITVGTLDEVAEVLGKNRDTVKFYSMRAYHNRVRVEKYDKWLLIYKYLIDEETDQ